MNSERNVCIVTGAATGVGAATAKRLAAEGTRLVVNYSKSRDEAEATVAAIDAAGGEAMAVQGDVALDGDCRRLAAAALERWGRIDWLVNNAGTTKFASPRDMEALQAEDFQRIYAVNLIGAYQMVRACADAMRGSQRGAIVNVSSIAGVMGVGSSIAYACSKGALNTLTLSLARSLGPQIRVNAVCPGFIEGRWLRDGYGEEGYQTLKRRYEEGTALGRAAQPEQVAETIAWLLRSEAPITGETVLIDSGLHLGTR